MALSNEVATIFGGTGFVGRYIVQELARKNVTVRVVSRTPEKAYFLRTYGVVGQIVPERADYGDEEALRKSIAGSDYVIYCNGVLYEKGKATFDSVHRAVPERIARIAQEENVRRLVHLSALGADTSSSNYAKSKLAGEGAVLEAFPKATILRPSVIFGGEDAFFNMFARMSAFLPALPLIGGGKTKFQPVYVADVAEAAVRALFKHDTGDDSPCGKIYELGGPEVVTFRQIYERLFKYTGRKRALIPLPFSLAKLQGCLMSILPNPPLTSDQVESLKTDNVVQDGAHTLRDLDIAPTGMDMVLPTYLSMYKAGGRFGDVHRT